MSRAHTQLLTQKYDAHEQEEVEINPDQLSGDQNVQRSFIHNDVAKSTATKANSFLTVMTIMKTIIGAGVLSLPYTISKLGYVFAIIIFVAVMALSYFSTTLLVKAKNLTKHSNYSTIFYFLHKKKPIKVLGSIFIVLKNVGICIAELTIFKESIRKILQDFITDKQVLKQWYTDEIIIILFIAALEFPLAIARKIERLKIFSFIGISGIMFFLICLLIHFFNEMIERNWVISKTMYPFPQDWLKFSSVIPNVLLSLTFQANFFPIYKGMKNSSDHRITSACLSAIVSCGSIYLIVSISTYMLYGSSLQSNFLLCLDKDQTQPFLYYGMNLGFLVSVLFAFPIMFFSARNNFIAIIKLLISHFKDKQQIKFQDDQQNYQFLPEQMNEEPTDLDLKSKRRLAFFLYYGLTSFLYSVIVLLAILVGDIQTIFNIVGAICSTTICFLFPYYFYFTITKKQKRKKGFLYYYTHIAFFLLIPYALFSVIIRNI